MPLAPRRGVRYNQPMFENAQLEKAVRMLAGMEAEVEIRLDPGPDPTDKFSEVLCRVIDEIGKAGRDKVRVTRVEPTEAERPLVTVANVRYRAVPFGPELEPFLELLVLLSQREAGSLKATSLAPARVQVLMAPTCPNCPRGVLAANRVAAAHPAVSLEIVDVQYYREVAGNVSAVPTVIIDGGRTVTGVLGEQELLDLLEERSSQTYLQQTLKSMVETGRMSEAAPLLSSAPGQEAFCAILAHSSMQQRIGLMLAVEETLAANPHAMDGAVPCLLPLLEEQDAALRGDTADLLGRIGAPGAREALTRLLQDGHPDVREVAEDALAMLRCPS